MQTATALIIDKRKCEEQDVMLSLDSLGIESYKCVTNCVTSVIVAHSFTAQHPLVAQHFLLNVIT